MLKLVLKPDHIITLCQCIFPLQKNQKLYCGINNQGILKKKLSSIQFWYVVRITKYIWIKTTGCKKIICSCITYKTLTDLVKRIIKAFFVNNKVLQNLYDNSYTMTKYSVFLNDLRYWLKSNGVSKNEGQIKDKYKTCKTPRKILLFYFNRHPYVFVWG